MDFESWAKKYEDEYRNEENPIKEDLKEKSPYFESISEVLQKRGYLLKDEFVSICKWKTERQTNNYQKNSKEDIEKITKEAISKHQDIKVQIDKLDQLKGVGVPVASAILTVIFPKYYCVLDFRAWRALHWVISEEFIRFENYSKFSKFLDDFRNYASRNSYIEYWKKIEKLANHHNMTPRKIEMALWKYDERKGIL